MPTTYVVPQRSDGPNESVLGLREMALIEYLGDCIPMNIDPHCKYCRGPPTVNLMMVRHLDPYAGGLVPDGFWRAGITEP